jgi:hypothetical protein
MLTGDNGPGLPLVSRAAERLVSWSSHMQLVTAAVLLAKHITKHLQVLFMRMLSGHAASCWEAFISLALLNQQGCQVHAKLHDHDVYGSSHIK